MRASRGSAGCGKCSGSTGSWRSSSSSSIIRRPSRVPGCQSSGTSVAAAISSRSWRDRQHAALRGQVRGRARLDKHRAHARLAAHADAVRHPGRHPHAARAAPPDARLGLHHHHARDRVEQLRAAMTMAAHAMAVLVVHRQSGHGPRRGFVGEQVQVRGGAGMVARRRGAGRGRRNVLFDDSCLIGGRRSVSVYLPSFPFT